MDDREKLPQGYWEMTAPKLFEAIGSSAAGLSSREAKARLASIGPNLLEIRRDETALRLLIKQFTSPLVLILIFAVAVSVFVGEWTDAAVIFAIVLGSGIISFVQEYSAGNAVAKLRARLRHRVNAFRDGIQKQIDAESIVPGDVVILSAGSLIPADGVVIEANDCFVNQAVLTGETFPVEKDVEPAMHDATIAERTNCVFMGTSVRSGFARVLITQTARMTEYGKIADQLSLRPPETEFQRGIRKFGMMLSRIMIMLVLVVFAVNVVMERPAVEALLFAIALAVGISPELLPAIITINLSKGAREMARSGVIVRRLDAIENLGSMDILCTDKTGTLTEGVVRLDAALDTSGSGSDRVYRLAYLNAHFQSGIPNPLDEAIISGRAVDISGTKKLGEVPYDFTRKRLSVMVGDTGGISSLITKGALDNVLDVCTGLRSEEGVIPLSREIRVKITARFQAWSEDGFRVLGVAAREMGKSNEVSRMDEREMTLEGFLLFLDPPKKDAGAAIRALAELKVGLKIITGDNRFVARHVADTVGMPVEGMLTGTELAGLGDEALMHRAVHTTLFVEVDPNQKERIIRALQKMGHVVGYMGDGINDAPALHDADVGISVEGAVDVAREAADFVLLRSGLEILERGIKEGRVTFANSLKYIFTTTSANFGNMFSMAGASLFLPFLPLLAKQILLNNFLSDIPAIAIAGDNVDPEYIAAPHRWDVKFIRNFMVVFGFVSSVFDFITFGLLLLVVRAAEPEFQTGWFIESLLTELVVALIVRTRRPFYKSTPGRWLWITTLAVSVLTIAIPYLPYANVMGFVPLPVWVTGLIVAVTLMYAIVTEAAKKAFYARMGDAV
ncbi:MAG: magnesium-translocating P-type ATPase [Pyrinomonadaceae bacterium]|nr:magnesium-translocating P-type ATPase [Pyrinomonadaceae bacterium]